MIIADNLLVVLELLCNFMLKLLIIPYFLPFFGDEIAIPSHSTRSCFRN